jgi:hypothetical protein
MYLFVIVFVDFNRGESLIDDRNKLVLIFSVLLTKY